MKRYVAIIPGIVILIALIVLFSGCSVELTIDPDLQNPIEITFNMVQGMELPLGESMTVIATTSEGVDSYQWYLNGELGGLGLLFEDPPEDPEDPDPEQTEFSIKIGTVGSESDLRLEVGDYRLDFVVYKGDIISSETLLFSVVVDVNAGFIVSAISGDTTEWGETATFTVSLTSEPTDDVVVDVTSSDITEGTVSPTRLTFTDLNWYAKQTVTVTGVDDFVADDNQDYTIVLDAATSLDPDYNGLDPSDVAVVNIDDETAGFMVSDISGDTTEEGGTATFTVRLTSEPIGNVVVDVESSDTGEGTVDKSSLTFTKLDWNIEQTVTVTGVDDDDEDGNQPYTIELTINDTGTSDTTYALLDPPDVTVINVEDDPTNGGDAGGGCTINKDAKPDLLLPIFFLLSIFYILKRYKRKGDKV